MYSGSGLVLRVAALTIAVSGLLAYCMSESETADLHAGGILFQEGFEGPDPLSLPLVMDHSQANSYARSYTTEQAFQGSKSARFELRDTDPEFGGGTRTDFAFKPATGTDRWYSFAAYFPAKDWGADEYAEVIAQWHAFPDENKGEQWRSPATKMLIHKDRIRFDVGYNANPVNSVVTAETKYDLGTVPKDSWQEFVVHIVHSYGSDGLVEVWQNGKKVVNHKGGNMFNDAQLPYLKLGIYKWDWNGNKKTDVSKRVLFLDNVKLGDQNASFQSMSSVTPKTPN